MSSGCSVLSKCTRQVPLRPSKNSPWRNEPRHSKGRLSCRPSGNSPQLSPFDTLRQTVPADCCESSPDFAFRGCARKMMDIQKGTGPVVQIFGAKWPFLGKEPFLVRTLPVWYAYSEVMIP